MKYALLLLLSCLSFSLYSQVEFKNIPPAATNSVPVDLNNLRFNALQQPGLPVAQPTLLQQRPLLLWSLNSLHLPQTSGVKVGVDQETGLVNYLDGRPTDLPAARPDKTDAYAYLAAVAGNFGIDNPYAELIIGEPETDAAGHVHVRVTQQFSGLKITQADAWIHATSAAGFDRFTGRLYPTPSDLDLTPTKSQAWAENTVKNKEADQFVALAGEQLNWISGPQLEVALEVYFNVAMLNSNQQIPLLAYRVDSRPNLAKHATTFLDAHSGEEVTSYSHICGFSSHGHGKGHQASQVDESSQPLPPDGPYTTTVQNLYDQNITLNTFSINDTYLLLDGTRDMFTNNGGEIDGLILTYEGGGGSPQLSGFNPQIASSSNNTNWSKTAASVHSNAGAAYQYFLDRHQRNSIDGAGGNVLSFMNINETDGTEMDNAFWNGRALFYGNGVQAFNRLPRGLDVAGHEMAHGVIQNTADLIYQEQPGALNESFADIFGYLVEGESGDFRIGENVVNTSVFPSGTMRNMQNPNNGAAGPQDFRWQPAHMDEYQNLAANEDNGGVHINSGIPNRAFYLFASHPAVGDTRAERVYYLALSNYLTRSSRFADLRIAVVAAAQALYGADVVAAANAAFDGVGIGGDGGGDYTEDLETNEGDRFLLATNTSQSSLFRLTEDGTIIDNPLFSEGIASKPSLTDDGEFAVFIDDQGRVRVYNLVTRDLTFLEQDPQTIWRNVAVSKDGNRLALTTNDSDNRILIFDLVGGQGQNFTLFNPTTSTDGITTGDVLLSDALEWDPSGEALMYDAQSQLDEGLTFWDIGFLNAWDNSSNTFGDGNIFKLANNLPDDVSIGNPTFSKNSPYIIAFERVNFSEGSYDLIGANIETGASSIIFENGVINYPNFGVNDDRMVFDAEDTEGNSVLAVVGLGDDKVSSVGNASILVNGGHWGIFYANGERDLEVGIDGPVVENDQLLVYPTVFNQALSIEQLNNRFADTPVQLFDVSGRLVAATVLNGEGAQTFRVGDLPAGTYVLAVTLAEGVVIRRVVRR